MRFRVFAFVLILCFSFMAFGQESSPPAMTNEKVLAMIGEKEVTIRQLQEYVQELLKKNKELEQKLKDVIKAKSP